MSGPLVVFVALIYVGIAVDQAIKHNWPMAAVFGGYAFSNMGFLFSLR